MKNKPILDACCGGKMFYFDKHDDRVLTARLVCDKSDNTMFWSISTGGTFDLEEPTHWQEIVFPKIKGFER